MIPHPCTSLLYVKAMAHIGDPVAVTQWNTHLLARRWNNTVIDAMGTYPIAFLAPDSDLQGGLRDLANAGFVSVTLVLDAAAGPPIDRVRKAFSLVRPFKTHYVVNNANGAYRPTSHHRYELRKAARCGVDVHTVAPSAVMRDFAELYALLAARHGIRKEDRFTPESLDALADCPGISATAAYERNTLVSCHLWIRHEMSVWSLLAASSDAGYASSAAYAIYDHAIRGFEGCTINLGGVAGSSNTVTDGLARFKSGFANGTRESFLAGSILDPSRYDAACGIGTAGIAASYFPRYRAPGQPLQT